MFPAKTRVPEGGGGTGMCEYAIFGNVSATLTLDHIPARRQTRYFRVNMRVDAANIPTSYDRPHSFTTSHCRSLFGPIVLTPQRQHAGKNEIRKKISLALV